MKAIHDAQDVSKSFLRRAIAQLDMELLSLVDKPH